MKTKRTTPETGADALTPFPSAPALRYTEAQTRDLVAAFERGPQFAPSDDVKFIAEVSGYASTPSVDSYGTIIVENAFEKSFEDFYRYPNFLGFHQYDKMPLGRVESLEVRPGRGLWMVATLLDTQDGRDALVAMKAGLLRGLSVGFGYPMTIEEGNGNEAPIIKEGRLLEISSVNVPSNIGSFIEEVKQRNLKIFNNWTPNTPATEERTGQPSHKGGCTMSANPITQKEFDELTQRVDGEVTSMKATAADISQSLTEMRKLTAAGHETLNHINDTDADRNRKVDALTVDFERVSENVEAAKKYALEARSLAEKGVLPSIPQMTFQRAMSLQPAVARRMFGAVPAAQIEAMQRTHDDLVMTDWLLAASSQKYGDGTYAKMPQAERVRGLKLYGVLEAQQRALAVASATAGAEFQTMEFSARIVELVRIEQRVWSSFPTIQLPRSIFKQPIVTSDADAVLMAETTAQQTALNNVETAFATGLATWTCKKARARIQISEELTEDSLAPFLPIAAAQMARAIARAKDSAVLNGSITGTHEDVDITGAHFDKAWLGLRRHSLTSTSNAQDCATFNDANLSIVRQNIGKYGIDPNALVWFVGIRTYVKQFLGALTNVQTVDKYGPAAAVLTGELAKYYGIPLVVSDKQRENTNAAGIYDGATTTKAIVTLANRNAWVGGEFGGVRLVDQYDAGWDTNHVYAYHRCDFVPLYGTVKTAAIGYNIA